MLKVKVIHT